MPLPASHVFFLAEGDLRLVEGSSGTSDSLAAAHNLQLCDNLTSSKIVNHAHNKPACLPHLSVITPCENCGGEGGWLDEAGRGYWDPCPMCDGTGELPSSERTLIDLEDLDRINRDKPVGKN